MWDIAALVVPVLVGFTGVGAAFVLGWVCRSERQRRLDERNRQRVRTRQEAVRPGVGRARVSSATMADPYVPRNDL